KALAMVVCTLLVLSLGKISLFAVAFTVAVFVATPDTAVAEIVTLQVAPLGPLKVPDKVFPDKLAVHLSEAVAVPPLVAATAIETELKLFGT
ncbi:hypothetical protein R7J51_23640, partial [Acinetobacter baumannii]|nr:hypothetical protein [Acinetobacter baumannii]